jgi:hypothetical protein
MTQVLDARKAYEDARAEAKALVDRARALLGLAIHEARQNGTSQTEILVGMKKSREQVRAFEKAYRDWLRDHENESLTA